MKTDDFLKVFKNEYATIASDGVLGDNAGYIDTGSYILNAQLSGTIYGGMSSNKITLLNGDPSTGKTFFALSIAERFMNENPDGKLIYFESESAVTRAMMEERGMDTTRIYNVPVKTVQEFRTQAVAGLKYLGGFGKDAPKTLYILDSLGNLSTTKEMEDVADGKETKDMTRAQLIKATFRVLTLELSMRNVPLISTNHVYSEMGTMYPGKVAGGGSGPTYSGSTSLFLSKAKEKDGTEVVGNVITCLQSKGRLTKENTKVKVYLDYINGLDRHWGLLELAEEFNIFKKSSTRYELPDGSKVFGKAIRKEPEKYFTKDILDQLDVCAKKKFCYGSAQEMAEAIAASDEASDLADES